MVGLSEVSNNKVNLSTDFMPHFGWKVVKEAYGVKRFLPLLFCDRSCA